MRTLLVFCSLLPLAANAQPRLGASVKIGAPVRGWFSDVIGRTDSTDKSGHRAIGAAVELRFNSNFSIESSGMYRRIGMDAGGGPMFYSYSQRERGYGWEFPVVARVRLPFRTAGVPFLEAGPSIHWLHTHTDYVTISAFPGPQSVVRSSSVTSETIGGETFGGGIETPGKARLSVEARYTHWQSGSCEPNRCENPHQVAIIFGLGF